MLNESTNRPPDIDYLSRYLSPESNHITRTTYIKIRELLSGSEQPFPILARSRDNLVGILRGGFQQYALLLRISAWMYQGIIPQDIFMAYPGISNNFIVRFSDPDSMTGDYSQKPGYRDFFNDSNNTELIQKLRDVYQQRINNQGGAIQIPNQEYQELLYEAYIRLFTIFREQNIVSRINQELFQ